MTTQAEQPGVRDSGQGQQFGTYLRRNGLQVGIICVFILMIGFLMIAAPRTFQDPQLLIYKSFADAVPFYGLIALPLTLLVVAQEIDLSFGSIMAVGVMTFVAVFNATGSPLLGFIACLAAGLFAGLLNGLIVVWIGIPSLIATIGTQFFWRGLVQVLTNASIQPMTAAESADPTLHFLLVGKVFGGWNIQFFWMILVGVAMWILLNRHRFGAHIYLIGDNNASARLMGINVDRTRVLMFALVGLAAAFAGIIATYDAGSFFTSLGDGYLLQTLAAVFLGGTPVIGGTGTILGTFIGCFIIGTIEPGTLALNLTGYWTQLIYGLIIVISVAMHTILRRRIR